MLWASVPLNMPFKFTLSWLKGAQTIEATTVSQLEKAHVRIGDTLRLTYTGMCNIRTPGSWSAKEDSPFLPFDCSQIVWNDAPPLPLPESDIVSKATALMQSVQRQLHPETDDDSRVSPALRSAIQKSGMVLLDDFGDIVQKTNDLCSAKDDCLRLKNALVNLGNTRNWETLTKRATMRQAGWRERAAAAGQRRVAGESGDHLNRALCDTRNLTGRAGAEQPGSRRFSYRQR